jgi:hypothetical protein
MTLAELQRTLTSVEPAAVLVPPRVIEAIIRQVLKLGGLVWSVPHSQSWIVDRTLLFRHVDQADLALPPDQILPSTVILLCWPSEEELTRTPAPTVLLRVWRQLFHASIHQAVDRAWEDGVLTTSRLREHIENIGPTAFEEVRAVLTQENILAGGNDDKGVFDEFAPTFLELYHFSPPLVTSFFPGISDPHKLRETLDRDLGSTGILLRTRLPGAPDPGVATADTNSEANEFFHNLEVSSRGAIERGNMVQAAIQLQRAVRVAPADQAPRTRKHAERILIDLLERLKAALELPADECEGWSRLLPILLDKADQGIRPAEAALLHDLQNICLDHEREMYKLDVVEYILSAGRRPLKRPLPSQRLVRITRTLRGAVPNLTAARLSSTDRSELEKLLEKALQRSEDRVRQRFRPLVQAAMTDVGLAPKNPLETVAFGKMTEEILDRVIDSGFLTFSDLRDTISRNQLKLPDLSDPQDFIRGDPLIRLDRRLASVLDGVYRPGEFYLRWLERFTALNFGTKVGRVITSYVTLPVIGGFLIVFALIRIFHLRGHEPNIPSASELKELSQAPLEPTAAPGEVASTMAQTFFDEINVALWICFSVAIFALIHSKKLRREIVRACKKSLRALQMTFIDFPIWIARHETLNRVLSSTAFRLFYWYVIKPSVVTALFVAFIPRFRDEPIEIVVCFLAANFVINSRPGEIIGQSLVSVFQSLISLLRAGLIPGLIRFIELIFKKFMRSIEGAMFTVDEWLRFRGGESNSHVFVRSVATLIWMPISYLARFNLVVLIEPCFHPLKFPVVTVATKFYIPFIPVIKPALASVFSAFLPNVLTEVIVWWLIFWLPDVFGFIFWEMKENWSLFRANRRETIEPAAIGVHGETIRAFFQPGFHSGTLPKLFAKIRHAESQALRTGNFSTARHDRAHLTELETLLLKFVGREFCALLQQSPAWRTTPVEASRVELASNRIRFMLSHPVHADQPLILTFENREGWIVASLADAPWLGELGDDAKTQLHNTIVVLYKIAGVDLIAEQIRHMLPTAGDHFTFSPRGLVIWPTERQGKELLVDLVPETDVSKPPPDPAISVLTWDLSRVLLSRRPLTRHECIDAWPGSRGTTPSVRLMDDIAVLPTPAAAEGQGSAA